MIVFFEKLCLRIKWMTPFDFPYESYINRIGQDQYEASQNLWNSWEKVLLSEALVYFLIFQSEDMLNSCLNFNESRPVYAGKRHIYKKI